MHLTYKTHFKTILPEPQHYIQQQESIQPPDWLKDQRLLCVAAAHCWKIKMNGMLRSHGPQKQTCTHAYTHAHRHVSHGNESSLNTLQNSCSTMGYVQLSSLTPVWECVCVCLWVRDPTTHGSRHHNGTQISTSQAIIISCQATRKTHIERPVLGRWPYKLISIIQI